MIWRQYKERECTAASQMHFKFSVLDMVYTDMFICTAIIVATDRRMSGYSGTCIHAAMRCQMPGLKLHGRQREQGCA